ncbi:MAG: hypothetical protein M1826_005649 [Phylliscum demangeonii]|nr:MAG: hypothetical protein M1826_005649 [Phylliscum demangeonii]
MSKVIRSVKNVTKGYSAVQVKVRNATSNDPWGPTGTEMSEIAQMTFNSSGDFYEIMDMLDKRMNDKGKNWRHVLKALKVLDYCLHEGSELVVTWARKNVYIVKTLSQFQYVDEDGRDVGQNVRVSAKELTALIMDEDRLRTERQDRKIWKSRVTGIEEFAPQGSYDIDPISPPPRRSVARRDRRAEEDDAEYRLAIEASKYEAEEDKKRRERTSLVPDDDDLAKAIKLSKEEEELRRRELEEINPSAVFDDSGPAPAQQPQYTGYNQGYQQQGAVDWEGNRIDQQPTGFLNNAYANANPTGFQSQTTGFPPQATGFPPQATGFQPQATGFQPQVTGYQTHPMAYSDGFQSPSVFDAQQLSPQATTQGYLQPQTTAFNNLNNPYALAGQTLGSPSEPPRSNFPMSTGSNNPWASSQTPDVQKPLATGSNNPFVSSLNRLPAAQQQQQSSSMATLNTLAEPKVQLQFNNHNFNPATSFSPPVNANATGSSPPKEMAPQYARLNALLATGDGMDTFGNTGELRIPAQHTAPGAFVNSAGQGLTRLHQNQTGTTNPFFQQQQQQQQQQQFTGVPPTTGFGNAPGFGSPSNGLMMPAQTGPVHLGAFNGRGAGFAAGPMSSNNPFGHGPQTHPQPSGSGSLIDL